MSFNYEENFTTIIHIILNYTFFSCLLMLHPKEARHVA